MKILKMVVIAGAFSFGASIYAAACRAPVAYGCLKSGWDKSCVEYFEVGTVAENNCASAETFLPDGCPATDRVGRCEVQFAGTWLIYSTYLPSSLPIATRNCARIEGQICD